MGRTWRLVWLMGLALGAAVAAACGSGGEESAAAPSQAQTEQAQVAQAAEEVAQEGESVGPQAPEAEPEGEEQGDTVTVVSVSYHKGVAAERHVLGEPDAPVVILHFGDFQ